MLSRAELMAIARARVKDAKALLKTRRYDGAFYLCGYALECVLKARIVATLCWQGFPETGGEFKDLQSFKTHDLDLLLKLSGRETKIRSNSAHVFQWSGVAQWDPEVRYKRVGSASRTDVLQIIQSVESLFQVL